MLIGIDTSRTTKPKLTGTEYYSIEIIKKLAEIDHSNRYLLYAQLDPAERLGALPANFQSKVMPFPKLWSQVRLSWEMLWKKPDVLFVPSHTVPLIHPKNTVVTLHDLGFKHFPELYSQEELAYHNWTMNFSAHAACQIITPSEFTRQDLIKTYDLDPSKIHVVWHGFDKERFKPDPTIERQNYILFIGRIEEKKNIRNMIKAYAMLRQEAKVNHKLVLAGSPGFGYEGIKAEITKLPKEIQDDIIETGYISEKDYIRRLQEADIFLFTTNFEGFGMPIIEAFACGTPVITSNVSSMPEIAGNAALLVDPQKPYQIAAAMSKLINDPSFKKSIALKGRVRSAQFSWDKAAIETLEVLRKANRNE